jgi:DNA-binding NtrC family response regulator
MTPPSDVLPLTGIPALVVEPDEGDSAFLVATLKSAGLIVSAADGFATARARLVRRPPTVLVTEIRLGYHNGLHLAHIARWMRRKMILVVTSRHRDPVLTRDAEALGALFVQKPLTAGGLLATLYGACQLAWPDRPAYDPAGESPPLSLGWPRVHER